MINNQKLAGSALTVIGSLLMTIMTQEDEIEKLCFVESLNDAAKLIIETHHDQIESRKAFIYPRVSRRRSLAPPRFCVPADRILALCAAITGRMKSIRQS